MDNAWFATMMEDDGGGGGGGGDGGQPKKGACNGEKFVHPGSKNILFIVGVSLILGISSFFLFCFWRPRWKSLYAARKRRLDAASSLPPLPDSFFGWMPVLYKVTEQQVLDSAGLDAYVFLHFFKVGLRLLCIMTAFTAVVITPINMRFLGPFDFSDPDDDDTGDKDLIFQLLPKGPEHTVLTDVSQASTGLASQARLSDEGFGLRHVHSAISGDASGLEDGYEFIRVDTTRDDDKDKDDGDKKETEYLWAYFIFTYFFSGLIIVIIDKETFKVLDIRQRYLARQSTVTDRTFRMSGFAKRDKSEAQIVRMFEKLGMGSVERVYLCRDWKEADELYEKYENTLRKLERAWANYHTTIEKQHNSETGGGTNGRQGNRSNGRSGERSRQPSSRADSGERSRLLESADLHHRDVDARPKKYIWPGRWGRVCFWNYTKVDAIDHYEEKLRGLAEALERIRADEDALPVRDMAFVTMETTEACQMANQTLIDPRPGKLLTKSAPSPDNVVWSNTYENRLKRRARRWGVNILVITLSVLWLAIVAFFATLMSFCTIKRAFPEVARYLARHEWVRVLVQSGLPTIAVSLLNVSVPFLYDFLSHQQGAISKGEVELSFISKNFFFNFFNIFLVFAISGSTSQLLPVVWETVDRTSSLPRKVAESIMQLSDFYISFIILQGVGLLPFRLLEPGGISQYLWAMKWAKSPREKDNAKRPPTFSYGYYLPTAILVFILCTVYSILQKGVFVLLAGVIYFFLGYYVYKYQLLYAMEDPQHATGEAWAMIAQRIFLGVGFFQLTMVGVMALQKAFVAAFLVLPLLLATGWYGWWYFRRRYDPLIKFISLRSIRDEIGGGIYDDYDSDDEGSGSRPSGEDGTRTTRSSGPPLTRKGSTVDEERERGMTFENPSMTAKLKQPWIYADPPDPLNDEDEDEDEDADSAGRGVVPTVPSNDSNTSLGDTHIWRS